MTPARILTLLSLESRHASQNRLQGIEIDVDGDVQSGGGVGKSSAGGRTLHLQLGLDLVRVRDKQSVNGMALWGLSHARILSGWRIFLPP